MPVFKRKQVLSLMLFLTVIVPLAAAQQLLQSASESLLIGPGDLLSVHVFREGDLDAKVRVKDAGTATLPLIGIVQVGGMAAPNAAELIERRYSEGGYLNHPQVSVLIEESATRQVAVLGEVARPGTVPLNSPRSLLDVLAEAGGMLKTADRRVTIRHPNAPAATVLIGNDAAGQLASANLLVAPGDTVLVPRAGTVYVLGDVARPGGYLMQDDAQLSLLQAIALAAGTTKTAAEGDARLIRKVDGVTTEQPLRLKAMERGKIPDLALQNGDIVYIPFSLGRNLALGASTIAASATSAIVYAAP